MTTERKLVKTADGSLTIFDPVVGEHFHSYAGAMGESMHVFIQNGFSKTKQQFGQQGLNVLEYGFGSGLNALLTALHAEDVPVWYTAVEKHPLNEELWKQVSSDSKLTEFQRILYRKIMECDWEMPCAIRPAFTILKLVADIRDYLPEKQYFHLIYFDAFSASVQPELWTLEVFERLHAALQDGGILVTYSARGIVKNALRQAGFVLERLPGFAGKRHMLRAIKY